MSTNPFLLPAFVAFDTLRAVLLYTALQSGAKISLTFVTFCAELLKAGVSVGYLLTDIHQEDGKVSLRRFLEAITLSDGKSSRTFSYGCYAIPAFLYFANGLLYLFGLQLTSPSLLHVATLAKIPVTAILHHQLLRSQRNARAWVSLAVLCVGLLVFQLPSNILELIWRNSDSELPTDAMRQFFQSASGSLVGLAIAFNSSFASIYSEVILKQPKSFWAAQFWLYLYGIAFAGFSSLFWDGSFQKTRQPSAIVADVHQYICINAAVIFATAGTGLAVAAILRKRDNLVKLIGTAAGMVTLVVVQSIAFPALRAKTLTVQTILGAGTIAITTWTYNYYKDLQPHSYMQLARLSTIVEDDDKSFEQFLDQKKCDTQISEVSIEEIEEEDSSSYSYSFTPTPTASRLCSAVLGVVVLATLTALFHPIAR